MTRKLTLSMDEDVIEKAKRLAAANNTSVSAMFTGIIRGMAKRTRSEIPIGPIARKATGIVKLPKGKSDREILTEALMEKYGFKG
jgi:hypothetical protein